MKIHCPNFVPKKVAVLQNSVKVCPKQLAFPLFQGNFTTLLFLVEIFAFSTKKFTFVLHFWLFHWKKLKNSTACKNMRNWWKFNETKENYIPLCESLIG